MGLANAIRFCGIAGCHVSELSHRRASGVETLLSKVQMHTLGELVVKVPKVEALATLSAASFIEAFSNRHSGLSDKLSFWVKENKISDTDPFIEGCRSNICPHYYHTTAVSL